MMIDSELERLRAENERLRAALLESENYTKRFAEMERHELWHATYNAALCGMYGSGNFKADVSSEVAPFTSEHVAMAVHNRAVYAADTKHGPL